MGKPRVPRDLRDVGTIFQSKGFLSYLVGGAVRDMIMGLPLTDYDLATNAEPDDVMSMFRRVIPTGIKHGTVTVFHHGIKLEVTTFRTDGRYSDSRHPDGVAFTPSIEEDLKRRDFTINALAVNLVSGELLDLHNGRRDLKLRLIRAIGNPVERFTEDGLRLLRACRFAAQLEFEVEQETLGAMAECAANIEHVSAERIQEELVKILSAARPSIAFLVMDDGGLLRRVLPELANGKGIEQKGIHKFDVFTHSLLACDGAPRDRLDLRLAALFHDLGKPSCLAYDAQGYPTFYNHEEVSERMTRDILRRLRFSNAVEESVCRLVRNHMFHYEENWSDAAIRRFVARVGRENIEDLFLLRRADTYGAAGHFVDDRNLADFSARIHRVLDEESALTLKDLAVNGNDLHEKVGIPKGPLMGVVLEELLSSVLDDPQLNAPDRLLDIARKFYALHVKNR